MIQCEMRRITPQILLCLPAMLGYKYGMHSMLSNAVLSVGRNPQKLMATPIPKTSELLETLTSYIDLGQAMPEWEQAVVRREIGRIDDPAAQAMLTAFCFGAANKESQAIASFEAAIGRFREPIIAQNYSTYLKRIGLFSAYSTVAYRLADEFEDPELVNNAYEAALVRADLKQLAVYAGKLRKYYPNERGEQIMVKAQNATDLLCRIEQESGVTTDEVKSLSERCILIASQHRKTISGTGAYHVDGQVAVVFYVTGADPDALADMNFDLAMSLSESDELIDRPVTAWFRDSMQSADGEALSAS